MKKYNLMFIIAMSTIVLFSCKKKDIEPIADVPQITINSPNGNMMFSNGDTVFIKGSVVHVSPLHEVGIRVTPSSATDTAPAFFQFEKHVDHKEYKIDTFYISNVPVDMHVKLSVDAVDHNGNKNSKAVEYHCMK